MNKILSKRKIIVAVCSLLVALQVCADGIKFTSSAPEAVIKGQQFRISFTVNTQKVSTFRGPSSADGFEILMGPTESKQSSMSRINGTITSTSSITYTYVLLAVKEGEFTIPGATVVAEGETKTSNPLNIRVLPPDKQQSTSSASTHRGNISGRVSNSGTNNISEDDLFITATVNKTKAYEQEAILLTYKVYYVVNLRELEIKMPDLKGFHTQEVELQRGAPQLEHYKGRNYRALVWSQYVLFPQHAGKLEIPSINFDATVAVQLNVDPFDAFFNGMMSSVDVRKTISTPKLTIDVSPLPAGKPVSFTGGVGTFDMNSSISTTHLKTNEAVTLKMEIQGVGNMKLMDAPEVKFPQDFEVYDPKIENNFSLTGNGLSGKKTIEYLAIPRHAGSFIIPEIEFSYFDIKSKNYKTLKTQAYELHVEKGENTSEQIVTNYTNKEDVKLIGEDIHYIQTGDLSLKEKGECFWGTWSFWMWYVIFFVLFILVVIVYRVKVKENANVVKIRTRNANKIAIKRLKGASKLLSEEKTEAFYDEILKALWGYVSDKLNIPVAQLSKDNIEIELGKYGVQKEIVDQFVKTLNECEFARYAPGESGKEMHVVYSAAIDIISKIENVIRQK